ncbi:MAG: sigma factor-like helix-turn-helix DNA-binding protein [Acidimicrobiia bacterium]
MPTATRDEYPSDLTDLVQLSPKDRAVVYLTVLEGRSFRDVAPLLGCTEQAARKRSARALAQLRRTLEGDGAEGEGMVHHGR